MNIIGFSSLIRNEIRPPLFKKAFATQAANCTIPSQSCLSWSVYPPQRKKEIISPFFTDVDRHQPVGCRSSGSIFGKLPDLMLNRTILVNLGGIIRFSLSISAAFCSAQTCCFVNNLSQAVDDRIAFRTRSLTKLLSLVGYQRLRFRLDLSHLMTPISSLLAGSFLTVKAGPPLSNLSTIPNSLSPRSVISPHLIII